STRHPFTPPLPSFPTRPLFRSVVEEALLMEGDTLIEDASDIRHARPLMAALERKSPAGDPPGLNLKRGEALRPRALQLDRPGGRDRKSTRLNSSHGSISYAVIC